MTGLWEVGHAHAEVDTMGRLTATRHVPVAQEHRNAMDMECVMMESEGRGCARRVGTGINTRVNDWEIQWK